MEQATEKFCVVAGLDFSNEGDRALREAMNLAYSRSASSLHVVHVATKADLKASGKANKLEQENAALDELPVKIWHQLGEVARMFDDRADSSEVSVHIRFGEPAKAIHQLAVDYDADVIVVGTHGRRGLEKVILGSVADELVKTARCPVFVVRPKDFSGLGKSDRIEPPQESDGFYQGERETHIYSSTQVLSWGRPSWLGGGYT
ncbi:MAG: universal stress protein [Myxococcota bacterium]